MSDSRATRRPRGVTRREALLAAAAAVALGGCGGDDHGSTASRAAPSPRQPAPRPPQRLALADLERRHDARLGVFGVDTGTGRAVVHRPDERFAFCSTHKALSAGALLRQRSIVQLRERIPIAATDLVWPSPVCERYVGSSMSLLELCDAAVRFSDNAAANHLLAELGGPGGLERELRGIGDEVTRCDRDEPELSSAVPGDPRDTSTARVLAADLRAYVLGPLLPDRKRALLEGWLRRNTTGDALVRSVAPAGWAVGDKTGTGGYGTRNDIAILWPPGRAPIVLAVLSRRDALGPDAEPEDGLVAAAARRALVEIA